MSLLDTIIAIGKAIEKHPQGMRFHRYINSVEAEIEVFRKKKDAEGNPIEPIVYEIPVVNQKNGSLLIKIEDKKVIEDEDYIKKIYTLNYKTSDRDSSKRYLFGDISYACYPKSLKTNAKLEENGNYRLLKESSFDKCKKQAATLPSDSFITKFRKAFEQKKEAIEKLLQSHPAVVIHFRFDDGKSWYELPHVMATLKEHMLKSFAYSVKSHDYEGYSLKKSLVTIGASDDDKSRVDLIISESMQEMVFKDSHQMFLFKDPDNLWALMYAIKFAETPFFKPQSDVQVVALPRGNNLNPEYLLEFFEPVTQLSQAVDKEEKLGSSKRGHEKDKIIDEWEIFSEPMLDNLTHARFEDEIFYDIIFMNPGSTTKPSVYLLVLENVSKSHLKQLEEKINKIKRKLTSEIKKEGLLTAKNIKLYVHTALNNILNISKGGNSKLRNHFISVLSKIYLDNYSHDEILLPAFVSKIEQQIREGKVYYHSLKYQMYFLLELQQNCKIMKIKENPSYEIGYQLGTMARPFAAWRDDCPLKSFEKNYVGNLTRRITYFNDLLKFYNFLNEKLTIHERMYPEQRRASQALANLLGSPPKNYDKNICALGFFEAYFQSHKKAELNEQEGVEADKD
ncbi:MAG: hypothetical protein D6732_10620 [Methanobacteriota archaeon]|nr:MAG: hypothetical protein D6732_10620 [Euryarchaeota archaeon]